MPAAPDQAAQESDLASYTQTLGCFFDTPLQSTKELPQDYNLSFFLLYQTFESKGEGSTYTQDDNYFWEIPESDLLQTAAIYLGLSVPFHFGYNRMAFWRAAKRDLLL